MKMKLKKICKPLYAWLHDKVYYIIGTISPKTLAGIHFKNAFGKPLDWRAPQNVNEKINWLKFYSDTSAWTILADKYRVREFVKQRGLESMLVCLYGRWDNPADIDWDQLPSQFILKTNNGSGKVCICQDLEHFDKKNAVVKLQKQMKEELGIMMAEPHYNKIKPCIIAEELLDATKQPIKSSSLIDYKIWAFNGKPAYIWACYNRTEHSVEVGVYDLEWNFLPEFSVSTEHYVLGKPIPKPQSLQKMIEAASVLSAGFPVVRVDLYEVDGKAYFGEMTFTPAAGYNNFYTEDFLQILGRLTKIK